jgi:hypothetical protein
MTNPCDVGRCDKSRCHDKDCIGEESKGPSKEFIEHICTQQEETSIESNPTNENPDTTIVQ